MTGGVVNSFPNTRRFHRVKIMNNVVNISNALLLLLYFMISI